MSTQRDTASAVEQAFHRAVEDVVATVGRGQAKITVGATERSPSIIELRPLRQGAARIVVQVTPGFYVVEIGEGGRFEFVGKREEHRRQTTPAKLPASWRRPYADCILSGCGFGEGKCSKCGQN